MRPLARSAAALGAVCAAPVGAALLALRPAWRPGWRERLGFAAETGPAPEPGAIWVHGASVGEIAAATSLLDRLRADGFRVCASTVTLTGRDTIARLRPDVPRRLAPFDHPFSVDASLARVAPRALVLIETELWPGWIAGAARRGVPVIVASGRISDRSFPRYERLGRLLRGTFRRLRAVGARAPEDAERFARLGVPRDRIEVTGDLKLEAPQDPPPLARDLDSALRHSLVWVAGSTHAGEEEVALRAHGALRRAGIDALLVLAPRHPARSDEVALAVQRAGFTLARRSRLASGSLAAGGVLLLDGIGDLAASYARATIAFVGGTLVPVGGHNLLEPVHAGRPVVFGPHTGNARAAAEILLASGAGARVDGAESLGRALCEAFAHPAAAAARGAAGREALAAHRGAAARAAGLVARVVAGAPEGRP
jgi:3-deoxy-D-manno-octulosonic-acid transferase